MIEFKNGATSLIAQSPTVAGLILDYHGNLWNSGLNTLPFCISLADTGLKYNVRIPVHLLGQREGHPSFDKGDFWGCNGYAQAVWCSGTVAAGDLVIAKDETVQSFDGLASGSYWVIGQAVTGGTNEKITIIDCVPTQYLVS